MNVSSDSLTWESVRNEIVSDWKRDPCAIVAMVLVMLIIITMTRAFALTNLAELVLVILIILNKDLRVAMLSSCRDSRVVLVLVFLVWIGISALWSEEATAGERFEDWWSWRKLFLVPICFSLFKSDTYKLILGASFVTTCSIYLVLSWLGYFAFIELDRAPSNLIENHATQGVMFATSILLLSQLGSTIVTKYFKILISVAILGFALNIVHVLTGRSSYLFLSVVAVAVAYRLLGKKVSPILLLAALLISLTVVFSSFETSRTRITQAVSEMQQAYRSPDYTSIGIRVVMWETSLRMISVNPVLGSGAGSFKYDYARLNQYEADWRSVGVDDPHQQYLHVAAEYGLVGLSIFLLIILSWAVSTSVFGNPFQFMALVVLLGTSANGFFNGHFSSFVEGRMFWIMGSSFLAGTPDIVGQWVTEKVLVNRITREPR